MQLQLAQQLALTDVRTEVTAEDLNTALRAFFRHLRRCTVCHDTGEVAVSPHLPLKVVRSAYDRSRPEEMYASDGKLPCPRCGDEGGRPAEHGDPEFVRWVCVSRSDYQACNERSSPKDGHEECARHFVLPLNFIEPDGS